MTTDIVKEWFIQSSTPLVGPDAAATLRTLLEDERGSLFLQQTKDYLQTLAAGPQSMGQ